MLLSSVSLWEARCESRGEAQQSLVQRSSCTCWNVTRHWLQRSLLQAVWNGVCIDWLTKFYHAMLCIVWTMLSQDVRLSVYLSVTCQYSVEKAKHIIKLFSLWGSHTILVFSLPNGKAIFWRGLLWWGCVECKGQCWGEEEEVIHGTRNRDTAVPAEGNGDLQTLICVLVARPRRCPKLSNLVPWQNWMVAYPGNTLQMKTLFLGWPITVHDTHKLRDSGDYSIGDWYMDICLSGYLSSNSFHITTPPTAFSNSQKT